MRALSGAAKINNGRLTKRKNVNTEEERAMRIG
jgi:hypothetical protein